MKTYDVYVQRCFTSYVAVQANSADDAEDLVRDMLNAKMIDPSQWDQSDFIESGEDMVIEEGGHA
jgi:hypothetical protein